MIYISGKPLLASPIDILYELRNQLSINGIELFSVIKPGNNNIQFTCPAHSDGQERKPSCGMLTVDKGNSKAGTVHCFACGYTASIEEMISDVFGKKDFGVYGAEWLIKNFLTVSIENRHLLPLNFARSSIKACSTNQYISEEELLKYRYLHEYMYKRKLTYDIIDKFDVGYDKDFTLLDEKRNKKINIPSITFPVRDMNGNTLFIVRRAINQKLFHYPKDVQKPLYGIYELPKHAKSVVICESVINALTCWVYGDYGIALLGTGTEEQYEAIKRLPVRNVILALDPDKAGIAGTVKLQNALRNNKLVYTYKLPANKDINDLSLEEYRGLEKYF